MVTFSGNSVDDAVNYTCNSGFELVGNATATCTQVDVNSAAFSPVPPVCMREYCMNIATTIERLYTLWKFHPHSILPFYSMINVVAKMNLVFDSVSACKLCIPVELNSQYNYSLSSVVFIQLEL